MSNLEAVTKVADQIISRLFDQRQFTSGEINHLVNEYGDRMDLPNRFDKLLKINENACLMNDTFNEDMCSCHDAKRIQIRDQVSSLVDRCESILRLEKEFRTKEEQILGEKRREMERRKQDCARKCNMKLERLKESIASEQLELERKYLKFEENLRNK